MKKITLLLSLTFALSIFSFGQGFLSTVPPLAGGNGTQGICFALRSNQLVIVDSLYCTFNATGLTDVWYTTTDTVGPPTVTAANGWTQIGTATIAQNANGAGSIAPIPLNIGVTINPGTNYRFYINGNIGAPLAYTTGAAGAAAPFTDGIITIETGNLYGYGGPAPNPGFHPRQFNGAVVYTILGGVNDAAVLSIDSPRVFCAGVENVVATIGNFGSNQIDSVDVGWSVNGVNQTPIKYIGLLDTIGGTGSRTAQITLGTFNFPAGSTTISAWTMNPNGVADTSTFNDTSNTIVTTATPPNAAVVLSAGLTTANATIGNAGNIDYVVVPFGNLPISGTPVTNVSSPFTITGLTASTTYDLYVRTNCGAGNVSAWVGPTTFNTAYAVPYFQDFENLAPGLFGTSFPEGWSQRPGSAGFNRWETEDANNGNNENSIGTGPLWDHTFYGGPTNGMYMFMETSTSTTGDTVDLYSPPIFIDTALTTVELGYWYFNHGANIDKMEVLVDTNGVEVLLATYSGQTQPAQSDPWLFASHFLNGFNGKSVTLIFRGYGVPCCSGDIAVDDISLDPVLPLDAGVTDVVSPSGSLCPGTIIPEIEIRNFGSSTLNSVKVYWDINGTLDSLTHTATILPGEVDTVALSPQMISATQVYNVTFYTGEVNGQSDQFAGNNTLTLNGLRTGLAGAVTLDPSLPASSTNFTSFATLANTLNSYGVCGNATVNVAPGVYNGAIELEEIPGASSTNTLTIDGGDSSQTYLLHNGVGNIATLTLDRSDWVTVKNFTIEAIGINGVAVLFTGGNDHCTISNNVLRVSTSSTSTFATNITFSGSTTSSTQNPSGAYSNNIIRDNRMRGGYYGVRMQGITSSIDCYQNKILNNDMDSIYYYGAYVYYQDGAEIIGNRIIQSNRGQTQGDGIYLFASNNVKIEENYVLAEDWAMYWSNSNALVRPNYKTNEVINNMFISTTDYASYLYSVDSVNFWFNSLQALGSSPALYIGGSTLYPMDDWDLRNNILSAAGGGAALDMFTYNDSIFIKMDNNNYYTTGGTLIDIDGTTYSTLAAYQVAVPLLNPASLEGDPQFLSNTDLHIIGGFVNDSGDASVPVFVDIDGDTRPRAGATSVDIGADEFDPPTCLPPLALRASNVTFDSASIAWSASQAGVGFQYIVVTAGSPPSSGVPIQTTSDSLRIGGLSASTTYQLYVRNICGRGDTSVWVGPSTFNTLIGVPYLQDFEGWPLNTTGLFNEEGWFTNGTLTPHWEISRLTTSSNTGPAADHTVGAGGTFLHLECSGGGTGDRDTLWSAPIFFGPTQANVTLKFWYHMYGNNMGSLEVYALSNGTYSPLLTSWVGQQQANQNDPWRPDSAFVNGYNGQMVQIVFVGIRGTGFRSDMAIDDVELYESLPVGIEDQKREGPQFSLSPNPSNGEFTMRLQSETTEQMQLNVLDMNGREVYAETISVKGLFTKDLDFTHLPKGMYFFRLQNGEVSKVEKIIIQ